MILLSTTMLGSIRSHHTRVDVSLSSEAVCFRRFLLVLSRDTSWSAMPRELLHGFITSLKEVETIFSPFFQSLTSTFRKYTPLCQNIKGGKIQRFHTVFWGVDELEFQLSIFCMAFDMYMIVELTWLQWNLKNKLISMRIRWWGRTQVNTHHPVLP